MRSVALISLSLMLSGPSWAQDASDEPAEEGAGPEDTSEKEAPKPADESAGPGESAPADAPPADAPPADAPPAGERELAVPANTPEQSSPVPVAPVRQGAELTVPPPPKRELALTEPRQPKASPKGRKGGEPPGILVDAGYHMGWRGMTFAPHTGESPHFVHANVAAIFENRLQVTGSVEVNVNPKRNKVPMVASLRFGFAEFVMGQPEKRGPFTMMQGYANTYVGVRWVHDYELGGGEWSLATADAVAVELGYTRAAPFGGFTIISDSQFALYVYGWKNWCRAGWDKLPLTLLNQRLSVGYDPVFLDFRFRQDPVLGPDLSLGASFQSVF